MITEKCDYKEKVRKYSRSCTNHHKKKGNKHRNIFTSNMTKITTYRKNNFDMISFLPIIILLVSFSEYFFGDNF